MTDTELRLYCHCGLPLYVLLPERHASAVLHLRNATIGLCDGVLVARGRCGQCGRYHEIADPGVLLRHVLDSLKS